MKSLFTSGGKKSPGGGTWVGLPSLPIMPKRRPSTKNKKDKPRPYLIIDESDRTEDTVQSCGREHPAPCVRVPSDPARGSADACLARRSSCGSNVGHGLDDLCRRDSGGTASTSRSSSYLRQQQERHEQLMRKQRGKEKKREGRRSRSESRTRRSESRTRNQSHSRSRRPSSSRRAETGHQRPRQRSLSQSRRRHEPSRHEDATSPNDITRTTAGDSRDDPNGACARHPYVQLRKFSENTNAWRVLLDECPVCAAIVDSSESLANSSSKEDPPSEDFAVAYRPVKKSGTRSRSQSRSRTVVGRRGSSRDASRDASRRSSLRRAPASSASSAVGAVKRVSFAQKIDT